MTVPQTTDGPLVLSLHARRATPGPDVAGRLQVRLWGATDSLLQILVSHNETPNRCLEVGGDLLTSKPPLVVSQVHSNGSEPRCNATAAIADVRIVDTTKYLNPVCAALSQRHINVYG